MKYKVGDKVRVRPDLMRNIKYGRWEAEEFMVIHAGKVGTITSLDTNAYELDLTKGKGRYWADEMLLPGKKRTCKKSPHVVVWEEDRDPAKYFEYKKDAFDYKKDAMDFAKGLHKKEEVKKESIRIYQVGKQNKTTTSVRIQEIK